MLKKIDIEFESLKSIFIYMSRSFRISGVFTGGPCRKVERGEGCGWLILAARGMGDFHIKRTGLVAFSSPEPTILLACGRNRELWEQPFWNNKGNNRILPIRSLVVCICGACLKLLLPELSIPATGQNRRIVGSGDENGLVVEKNLLEAPRSCLWGGLKKFSS